MPGGSILVRTVEKVREILKGEEPRIPAPHFDRSFQFIHHRSQKKLKWKRWKPPQINSVPVNYNLKHLFPEGEYEHEKAVVREMVKLPNTAYAEVR